MRYLAIALVGLATCTTNNNPTGDFFYRVTNVATDDVLNIRAQPDASAQIVGSYPSNAQLVEISGRVGGWARVNLNEGVGWVNTAFLSAINPERLRMSNVPIGLNCRGEEPFWLAQIGTDTIVLNGVDLDNQLYGLTDVTMDDGATIIKGNSAEFGTISMRVTEEPGQSAAVENYYNWRGEVTLDGAMLGGTTGCELRAP